MKSMILSLLICVSVLSHVGAQKSPVFVKNNAAIGGYDPVAFFFEGKPVMGKPEFSFQYQSATWRFSSRSNLDAFKKSPEKFAPQFGGYCAFGMADGHKAPTEPDTWTIVDGKLYFNYNADVKKLWVKKQGAYIIQANQNWPRLKDKE